MNDRKDVEKVQLALNTAFSSLKADPWLAQKVLANAKGDKKVKKKLSVGFILLVVILAATITGAFAGAFLAKAFQITVHDKVTVYDLIPSQLYIGNGVVKLNSGYLRGGYEVDDDCIGAMQASSALTFFNVDLQPQWETSDARLTGCLLDQAREADGAIYLGTERFDLEQWRPAIVKINTADGRMSWIYQGDTNTVLTDFAPVGGGVIAVGYKVDEDSGERRGNVQRIDREGNAVWEFQIDEVSEFNALSTQEGHFITMGRQRGTDMACLYAFDLDGHITGYQAYDVIAPIGARVAIQKTFSGKTIAIIYADVSDDSDTSIIDYIVLAE